MAAMVRVGRGAAGHFAQKVAGNDGVGISPAHAAGGFGRDLAWAHMADAAAHAIAAEFALIFLRIHPGEAGIDAFSVCFEQHLC
jgi:hypothetical protein